MKILFLGNMNNLPYYFASELKKREFNINFIVDACKRNLLDRPESWDNSLTNNYPNWINEMILNDNFKAFKFSMPLFYLKKFIILINAHDIIFLNGYWISLANFIPPGKKVIAVIAGFDLDVLADTNNVKYLSNQFYKSASIYKKLIPSFFTNFFLKKLINLQRKGIKRADIINYFPSGINPVADKLLNEIKAGQIFKRLELRGFDCDKFPYKKPLIENKIFTILNITRFFYLNKRNDNKRNDIMIKGIGSFIKKNNILSKEIKIIFFEKGDDINEAKRLCDENGLTPFISWEKQTSVEKLNTFFAECDVAFDQLGVQWVGAGLFSMLTGRPLIANGRPDVFEPLTKEISPICQATNEQEVEIWLTKLYKDRMLIKEIGTKSREYVLRHFNIDNTINYFIENFS